MTWQDSCRAAGGTPVPDDGKGSGPSCRFIGPATAAHPNGTVTYKPADMGLLERLAYTTSHTSTALAEAKDKALGEVVAARDTALTASGLDHGLPGVVGKLLGIPPWLVLVAVAGGIVLALGGGSLRRWE